MLEEKIKNHRKEIKYDRDKRIFTRDGIELVSVTNWVKQYTEKFDADAVAERMANKDGTKTKKQILDEWSLKGEESIARGKSIHDFIDRYLSGDKNPMINELIEKMIPPLVNYLNEKILSRLEVVDTEFKVSSKKYKLFGIIDCLLYNKNTGEYHIIDWKTNEKIKSTSFNGLMMKSPFEEFEDCQLNHYFIQLSLYKFLLETEFGIRVNIEESGIVHINKNGFRNVHQLPKSISDKVIDFILLGAEEEIPDKPSFENNVRRARRDFNLNPKIKSDIDKFLRAETQSEVDKILPSGIR